MLNFFTQSFLSLALTSVESFFCVWVFDKVVLAYHKNNYSFMNQKLSTVSVKRLK
jgi:hypothetical protein